MTATLHVDEVNEKVRRSVAKSGSVPSLAEIQEVFQKAVLTGDENILRHICDSSRTDRQVLLGVYKNAYILRLIEVVRGDHPLLAAYLGDDAFEELVRTYIANHPSRTPNARWVAGELPEFLKTQAPYCEHPEVHDLACLEFALNMAFDAVDDPVVDLAALAGFSPETWGALAFVPHPSVQRLDLVSNAAEIWLALKSEEVPPVAELNGELDRIIVWRDGVVPKLRQLADEEAMMWDEAAKGVSFGALCELCAVFDDPGSAPLRAAGYLNNWLGTGMLTRAAMIKQQEC